MLMILVFITADNLDGYQHKGQRIYSCRFCMKILSRSDHLAIHERIHTGEKPYNCEICGKPYSDKSNLRKHEKNHMIQKINAQMFSS